MTGPTHSQSLIDHDLDLDLDCLEIQARRAAMDGEIGIKRVRSGQPFPATEPCDWLAFDIETANESRGSICSIGVALVRSGTVVAAESQ